MLTQKYVEGDYEDLGNSHIFIGGEILFVGKRNPHLSNQNAIRKISSYGVANVREIGRNYILEEYVEFEHTALTLEELSTLLKAIHSNVEGGNSLVHGDYSRHNTTRLKGIPKCFDYEYSHFGNSYRDIGRVILRECAELKDVYLFFEIYAGKIPSTKELREGFISFCDWHHLLRKGKNTSYQNVPLLRKEQIIGASENNEAVISALKQNPPIEKCIK